MGADAVGSVEVEGPGVSGSGPGVKAAVLGPRDEQVGWNLRRYR